VLPEGLPLVAQDSSYLKEYEKFGKYEKTYVAYISSKYPKTGLYRIELAVREFINKEMGYIIYVEGTAEKTILKHLKKLDYKFVVHADLNGEFRRANRIEEIGYVGFIVNKEREVLTIPMINYRQ